MRDAIDEKTTEVRQHEVASDLLSKYRDQQAKRAWPRLEQVASTLLSAATDGRYADVKLSEDYRPMIVDRGEDHELTRFSGGEQDLANLCLRLAIADWVSEERNVDLGFVVLDEVFGSQDDERRQRLLTELRALPATASAKCSSSPTSPRSPSSATRRSRCRSWNPAAAWRPLADGRATYQAAAHVAESAPEFA